MRGLIQRVKKARVIVDETVVGEIKEGLLLFIGMKDGDQEKDLDYMLDKVINLRIFKDEQGKMNLSLLDVKGELLIVSQFTLYGDSRKGRRPNFSESASFQVGKKLYEEFIKKVDDLGVSYQTGIFGADMDVELINDGPVTILLDSERLF